MHLFKTDMFSRPAPTTAPRSSTTRLRYGGRGPRPRPATDGRHGRVDPIQPPSGVTMAMAPATGHAA